MFLFLKAGLIYFGLGGSGNYLFMCSAHSAQVLSDDATAVTGPSG